MSLYNALFGVNKVAPVLLKMLNIDQPGSEFDSGRFRDIFLNEDGTKIFLYTRNGGGNRETYQDTFDVLATHPQYLTDYDDAFDCTYATIEFSVPKEFEDDCKSLATGDKPESISDKFKALIGALEQAK
jgi:hypothetical protein